MDVKDLMEEAELLKNQLACWKKIKNAYTYPPPGINYATALNVDFRGRANITHGIILAINKLIP